MTKTRHTRTLQVLLSGIYRLKKLETVLLVVLASNMIRLFTETGRQFQVIYIIFAWLTFLTTASLTVEERLQALEATNVEIKQVLEVKSQRIEALESEVQLLKSIVIELKRERETSNKLRKRRENNSIASNNQPTRKIGVLRTCRETYLADPSLQSGMHWIDPDGRGIGDDPIQVYYDMTNGATSVLHDSESPENVGHCNDPGCYSKIINYSATKRQMAALIDLSNECHQSFRYDCNYAPFETNSVVYSWWNDRHGNPQYFWAGSNSSVHTCQCGIDRNCIESVTTCNCDSTLPSPKIDSGVITNKDLLPVTRLNFGRTWLNFPSGVYTLGRLTCSGTVAIKAMPSSCTDLWQIGHTLNGLYSVLGDINKVESVYCDFTKLYSEAGFQNRLGYVDVKSSPVYFYVQRNSPFSVLNTPIPFELERTNTGGAMNLTSGIFTAPETGHYFFIFSGLVRFTSSICHAGVVLVLNDASIGMSWAQREGLYYDTLSLQSTLDLKAGDSVWLIMNHVHCANLHDDSNYHYTHFSGQLL